MATAEPRTPSSKNAAIHSISSMPNRTDWSWNRKLEEEIDELRRCMAEAFEKEASFTSDSVIEISRQLDTKIIEYMSTYCR